MRYVLASASPRRKELLRKLISEFEIIPAVSEEVMTKELPFEIVEELSFQKADEIFNKTFTNEEEGLVVIGADTVVSYNHKILGKPADRSDAFKMVEMLSGKVHNVYTGVSIFWIEGGEKKSFTFSECTEVEVAEMSPEEIKWYVDSGECDDKAGAYGIQGLFARFITGIQGDYYNVMGLPVARLYEKLKEHGLI